MKHSVCPAGLGEDMFHCNRDGEQRLCMSPTAAQVLWTATDKDELLGQRQQDVLEASRVALSHCGRVAVLARNAGGGFLCSTIDNHRNICRMG